MEVEALVLAFDIGSPNDGSAMPQVFHKAPFPCLCPVVLPVLSGFFSDNGVLMGRSTLFVLVLLAVCPFPLISQEQGESPISGIPVS